MRIKKMSIVALAYHEILYRDIKANDILPNKKVELCYEYLQYCLDPICIAFTLIHVVARYQTKGKWSRS